MLITELISLLLMTSWRNSPFFPLCWGKWAARGCLSLLQAQHDPTKYSTRRHTLYWDSFVPTIMFMSDQKHKVTPNMTKSNGVFSILFLLFVLFCLFFFWKIRANTVMKKNFIVNILLGNYALNSCNTYTNKKSHVQQNPQLLEAFARTLQGWGQGNTSELKK